MTATATYRTPGVYVEFQDSNSQAISLARSDIAGFIGLAERGPLHRATKVESLQQFQSTYGRPSDQAFLADAVAGFFANGGRTCWVVRVDDPAAARRASATLQVPVLKGPVVLEAADEGAWGNSVTVAPIVVNGLVTGLLVTAADGTRQTVPFEELQYPFKGDGAAPRNNLLGVPDHLLRGIAQPTLVRVRAAAPGAAALGLGAGSAPVRLSGGRDGLGTLRPAHFSGDPLGVDRWGADALLAVAEVSFVAAPDLVYRPPPARPAPAFAGFGTAAIVGAQTTILARCIAAGHRLVLLDPPQGTRGDLFAYLKQLTNDSCAALYYPWIVATDSLAAPGSVKMLPPSGHVAGLYARVDRLRGVHKPPANEVLEGAWNVLDPVDPDAHGALNDLGVNAIRALPGRAIRVLGARTLSLDPRWRYVNVRRLFAVIEREIERRLQWVVFEPNSPRLWSEIDRTVRRLLESLFRSGMLDGTSSDDAYFVTCDDTTNPAAGIDEGRVVCLVGLQPPFPAEFIVARIGITRSGIEVEEKGAQDV